jgi:FKBP-type peptidyl-prolyl cis-trans isomerase FkpA
MIRLLGITLLLLPWLSCGPNGDGRAPVNERRQPTHEEMIEENRSAIKLENHDIELYVRRYGYQMESTGTGIRYSKVREREGENVRPGQWAMVNYRVELLNGDTAYKSEPGEPEAFLVEMDDVESGLHEGIQLMSPGDSAVIIIPSYRAHGLIGDQNKIPMRSALVYHIGLAKVSGTSFER